MYLPENDINIIRPAGATRQSDFLLRETLLEQGSGLVNEDVLAVNDDMFVVCDGATSLGGAVPLEDDSGGKQAATITAEAFAAGTGSSLVERARLANAGIRQAMGLRNVDPGCREGLWSTSFAAVQIQGETLTWSQSGDCMILLLYVDGSSRLITSLPGHDEQVLAKWQEMGPAAEGTIHEVLAEDIAAVRRTMNRRFGALNGEPEALDFLASGREDLQQVSDILLFSDGMFPPSEFPDKPFDLDTFVQLYRSGGLCGVRAYIRSVQKTDPRCHRYPRFKMYDDISAIALSRA